MKPLGHQPALDGLRGLAISLVMLLHAQPFIGSAVGKGGFLGVDLFFVLSGFLITRLLLERRHVETTLWPFYRRRAVRLLPAILFFLTVASAFYAVTAPSLLGEVVRSGGIVLAYVTNWFQLGGSDAVLPTMSHLWSLAIEEQFYIVWPVVLMAVLKRGVSPRRLAALLAVVVVMVGVWKAVVFSSAPMDAYFRTDTRADALLIGCILALTRPTFDRFSRETASIIGSTAMALFLAAALAVEGRILFLGGFSVVALLAAVVITAALDPRWSAGPILRTAPLTTLGRMSYSLYLWHFPMFELVRESHPGTGVAQLGLALAASFAAAAISYRFVEQPCLRWKSRIDARSTRPPPRPGDTVTAPVAA